MKNTLIDKIFIDPEVINYELTQKVIKNSAGIPVEKISKEKLLQKLSIKNPITTSKKNIFVTYDQGHQLKRCPGTRGRICCNYHVINQGVGCPYDCSYCFLQDYNNLPATFIYANTDNLLSEIITKIKNSDHFFRIGTGEMTDSLALDHITEFSKTIIPIFNDLPNAILELKTKSNQISNLLEIRHSDNIVIAWSLNPQTFIDTDELFTASLAERIEAAAQVQKHGYKLAFHFDPMVLINNWQEEYQKIIKLLEEKINPENVVWISVGSFRYKPSMKKTIDLRFPESKLTSGEFLLCNDDKMRYFKPLRLEMYRFIIEKLHKWNKELFIYFCMEDKDIWKSIFNKSEITMKEVDHSFIKSLALKKKKK